MHQTVIPGDKCRMEELGVCDVDHWKPVEDALENAECSFREDVEIIDWESAPPYDPNSAEPLFDITAKKLVEHEPRDWMTAVREDLYYMSPGYGWSDEEDEYM
jgi:hypothetical protein